MKKIKKILLLVLVFIAGIVFICVLWMHTPGIHFLFGFMHADVKESCYLYNPNKEKFLGKTEVVVRGWRNGITKKFYGTISVAGYEAVGARNFDDFSAERENSKILIIYGGMEHTLKVDSSGGEYWDSEMKYQYWAYIDTRNNNDFIIDIVDDASNNIYTICADTEEEAKDKFKKFWKNSYYSQPF